MSILSTKLKKNAQGFIESAPSKYNPNQEVKDMVARIVSSFEQGKTIQTKDYKEFNGMSLINRMNKDQRSFNAWQEEDTGDTDDDWKSRAVRPIVRNKIISIAAHITAQTLFPKVYAQNKNDEEDKEAALVMRDLMEYAAEEGDYDKTFLGAVIAALVNPATIIHTEFTQTVRNIKEIKADGTWETKEVLDELFSGFSNSVVPIDELFIENVYESNIQKQGYIIRRKVISFSSAQAKYNSNSNFIKYVRGGVQAILSDDNATFYDQEDSDMTGDQVEEVVYWNRNEDLRLVVVNGILLTEVDQPNPRNDKTYPFAKTGYELIDEGQFFYYRSLANKTSVDEEVVNTLYRMIIDGTFLQLMPPAAVYGDEEIDSSVIAPGMVNSFEKDTKMETIGVGGNLSDGRATLEKVESSISESSVDRLSGGQTGEGTPSTAYELSRVEQNARIMLGLFGKMIGFLVKDWGDLIQGDVKQFATVGEYSQLTNTLKFRKFLLPEKTSASGSRVTKKIEFKTDLPKGNSEQETVSESFKILEEEGGLDSSTEIARVNPALFRDLKFKTKMTAEMVSPISDNVEKALNLEAYDRAITNPLADQENVYRDLLLGSYDKTKDDPDKYIIKQQAGPETGQLAQALGAEGQLQ